MFNDIFDFNPLEVGNPMVLGFIEENISKDFVDCNSPCSYDFNTLDSEEDDDDDDYPYVRL